MDRYWESSLWSGPAHVVCMIKWCKVYKCCKHGAIINNKTDIIGAGAGAADTSKDVSQFWRELTPEIVLF